MSAQVAGLFPGGGEQKIIKYAKKDHPVHTYFSRFLTM